MTSAGRPGGDRMAKRARDAGPFSSWLRQVQSALAKGTGMDVPCADCTACCTSSYFIHIRPEEIQTLARIPKKLLFPAPGLAKGHVLLGYFDNGHCPMLQAGKCSIYAHRPLTCRMYDCRVFAATGLSAGQEDKALIQQRVRQWKFAFLGQNDRKQLAAVRAAARFIQEQEKFIPSGTAPGNSRQAALLAIKAHAVFLGKSGRAGKNALANLCRQTAQAMVAAEKRFNVRLVRRPLAGKRNSGPRPGLHARPKS